MTELSISAAARTAGVSRTTIQKAIKTGRLSATTNATGNRVIDLSELLRVYGPLQPIPQGVAVPTSGLPQKF
jgi:predicted site-specific integrase-resolvase